MCSGEGVRVAGQREWALGVSWPGKAVQTLKGADHAKPGGFSCVSVFGGVERNGRTLLAPSDAPATELVRFNLFAEVQNVQQHVASAFVRGSQSGLIFNVTGMMAEAWYVFAQALDMRDSVRVSMHGSLGCSSLSIRVPTKFRTIQSDFTDGLPTWDQLPAEFTREPFAPLETSTGFENVLAGVGAVSVDVPTDSRVLRATFTGAGTVVVTTAQGSPFSLVVAAGSPVVLEPRGTLAGPVRFDVPLGVSYVIELVR